MGVRGAVYCPAMPAVRRPPAVRRAAVARAAAATHAAAAGCGGRDEPRAAAAASRPAVEFLVAAGDSTYWVASGPGGVRVRASPLFLARWGGRLAEVYVADDERAFDDGAWFAAQRVYRRDLLTGDSALVFADPAVPRLAARHAARHPDARVLDPDERADGTEDDESAPGASTTVALAGAHGPFLSLEQHTETSADATEAGDDPAASGPPDVRRRRVVDLRTGREATLADLFGPAAAASLDSAGRRALDSAVAALRPAARRALRSPPPNDAPADDADDAPRRALAALATLHFDPRNFGLAAHAGRPAVGFVALGRDDDGAAVTLALPPTPVPGPAPEWWRRDVEPTLFVGPGAEARDGAPAGTARWRATGGAYEVRARVAAGAASLELVPAGAAAAPRAPGGGGAAPAAGAGAAGTPAARRAVPLARVPAPLQQLIRLDAGAVDPATRRALRRAFDESAFYDDATTSVAWAPGRAPAARPGPTRRAPARRAPATRA